MVTLCEENSIAFLLCTSEQKYKVWRAEHGLVSAPVTHQGRAKNCSMDAGVLINCLKIEKQMKATYRISHKEYQTRQQTNTYHNQQTPSLLTINNVTDFHNKFGITYRSYDEKNFEAVFGDSEGEKCYDCINGEWRFSFCHIVTTINYVRLFTTVSVYLKLVPVSQTVSWAFIENTIEQGMRSNG